MSYTGSGHSPLCFSISTNWCALVSRLKGTIRTHERKMRGWTRGVKTVIMHGSAYCCRRVCIPICMLHVRSCSSLCAVRLLEGNHLSFRPNWSQLNLEELMQHDRYPCLPNCLWHSPNIPMNWNQSVSQGKCIGQVTCKLGRSWFILTPSQGK